MGYIYKITNVINNKSYVGVTIQTDASTRFKSHMSSIRNGRGCPLLKKAVNKYGEASFKFEVLIICFDNDVYKYEEEYIMKFNTMSPNGYNVAEGGKSSRNFLGKTHSEQTRQKIGEKSKEFHNRPEIKELHRQQAIELNARINMSEILKKSEKWQKAVEEGRIGNRGGKHNSESNKKISESVKKYFNNIDNKKKHSVIMRNINGTKIFQYNKDDVLIASYNSIIEASEITNINRATIQSCASRRIKTGGGFIWKYTELKEDVIIVE